MNILPRSSRYELLQRIASGGMGSIFLATQLGAAGFVRRVAVKRTHPHLLVNPHVRHALLSEARNASLVRHPNVVSINDVEEVDGELLLVMDFIDGSSLSQLVGSGHALPFGIALRVIIDACDGLDAIHRARDWADKPLELVHRDVSPQNILVGVDGLARIADFGIAKSVGDLGVTGPTMRRGKFGYMSPEYIKMRVSTSSSDLFALGVVLWEALAGRRLFEGANGLESLRLAMKADVPSLRELNPFITPELDAVVRRALARSPLDRFDSVRALGAALARVAGSSVASHADVANHVLAVRKAQTEATIEIMAPHIETLASVDVIVDEVAPASATSSDIVEILDSIPPMSAPHTPAVSQTRELAPADSGTRAVTASLGTVFTPAREVRRAALQMRAVSGAR